MSQLSIIQVLGLFAEQTGESVSSTRLEFMTRRLVPLGTDAVIAALEKMLEKARRFPTIQEIKDTMGLGEPTARDIGNDIAALMLGAMGKVGVPVSASGIAARDALLGPAALYVAEKMGGWSLAVDQAGENLAAFRAQVRDLAESYARQGFISEKDIPRGDLPSYGQILEGQGAKPALPASNRLQLVATETVQERALKLASSGVVSLRGDRK